MSSRAIMIASELSENNKKSLPEIIKILEETYLPIWYEIKDTLVLFSIEEFAEKLKTTGEQYDFSYLIEYADLVLENIEMIDIEALNKTLSEFPDILTEISQYSISKSIEA